jgi:hypothetical protein
MRIDGRDCEAAASMFGFRPGFSLTLCLFESSSVEVSYERVQGGKKRRSEDARQKRTCVRLPLLVYLFSRQHTACVSRALVYFFPVLLFIFESSLCGLHGFRSLLLYSGSLCSCSAFVGDWRWGHSQF